MDRAGLCRDIDEAVHEWDKERLVDLVLKAKEYGFSSLEIVNDILFPQLLKACKAQRSFDLSFSELLLMSDTIQGGFDLLIPEIKASASQDRTKGTVVIGTVEGDIHDFGKNLVAALFESGGYRVIDLGRDVPLEKFLETVEKEEADMIAVSALMTPAMANMRRLLSMIHEKKLNVKTIIGGLATSPEFAKEIGADAWAEDAVTGLSMLPELIISRNGDQRETTSEIFRSPDAFSD